MRLYKQRLSYSDKIKNNNEWGKQQINAILDNSYQYWTYNNDKYENNSRLAMMLRSYKLYNNIVDQEDLDNDFNPAGIDIGQKRDKIMPYNKAHNKINTLIGELIKRPFNYKAVLINSEGAEAVREVRKKLLVEYIQAEVQKNLEIEKAKKDPNITPQLLQQLTAQLNEKYKDVLNPEGIEEYVATEYLEPREIKTNKLLNIIVKEEDILDKKKDSFKHGLLSDEEHCWVGVENGKVSIKLLNPLGIGYHKSPDVKYIQDGDYAYYNSKMSIADVLDTFRNLEDEDKKRLEEKYLNISKARFDGSYDFKHLTLNYMKENALSQEGQYGTLNDEYVDVAHVEWRSQRKIGFLTYIDDNNELQETIVDESFVFDKDNPTHIKIDWDWIPERWEGVRLDFDIYTDIRPCPYQYIDEDNPYYQPLSYHGIVYNNTNAEQISTMERMRPFQLLFLTVAHKLKKLLTRDKGMVIPIDVSRLPSNMELEEVLYYLDELDVFLYNSLENANEPGSAQRAGIDSAINRSSASHILQYIQILNYIDEQIGEVAGVSRPREGQTSPYDPVGNVQQSIIQSSNITEILFDAHNKHWEKVLNTAANLAVRLSEENGYESYSIDSNLRRSTLSIDKGEMLNCKFNVIVVDSARDNQVFNELKSLSQVILQRDKGRLSDVIKMIKQTSSIEELIKDVEKFETRLEQQAAMEQQTQQQLEAQRIQAALEAEERKFERDKELKYIDIEGKIKVAEITSFMGQMDQDINDNNVPDQLEIDKLSLEREKLNAQRESEDSKQQLEREKLAQEERKSIRDAETKIKVSKMRPRSK